MLEFVVLFVPFVTESYAVSKTERLYKKQIMNNFGFFKNFYFEIKPPPTGSASRIDDCSLRDVTTCCQTVLASKLVLFGLRL